MMQTMEITDRIRSKTSFYRNWPLSALKFNVDRDLLVDALGANHLIGIPGDFTREITYACQSAGIKVFRTDSDKEIKDWKNYYIGKASQI